MLDSLALYFTMEQLSIRFDIPLALVSPDEIYQNAEVFEARARRAFYSTPRVST